MMEANTMAKRIRLIPPPSCAANLPDEIVNEILLLLPARSVLRCRAVCRLWAAHLSSPGFAAAYAAKARARRMSKFVFFAPSTDGSTAVYSCSQRAAIADPLFTVGHVRPDSLRLSSRPCNGLVLFSDTGSGTYWVCNPSTGECRRLPQQRRGLRHSSAGLVFDGRTKECKVVHLFIKGGAAPARLGCEVYTLGDDAPNCQWRPATGAIKRLGMNRIKLLKALEAEGTVTKVPPVFANGCLHWLLYPSSNSNSPQLGRDAILCFSGEYETFGFISAPAGVHMEDYIRLEQHLPAVPLHLAEVERSLCMVHDLRSCGRGQSWLHVWALRDRSTGEWSLDYRVALTPLLARNAHCPRFITVLGCRGSDNASQQGEEKLLLIATSQHKVHAYDPVTGDVETVALFSVRETNIIVSQKEAAAALWVGLYEDNLTRIGTKTSSLLRGDKQELSLVTEILLRLPIKSIVQSMLVCKKWCDLIQSDRFASQMAMKRQRRISMVTNSADNQSFFHFAPVESWLIQAPVSHLAAGKIVCSKPCHGLNLISTISDDYLCNPCTGAVMCLGIRRKPHLIPCSDNNRHAHGNNAFSVGRNVGFGFDQATGEHVAVEIGFLRGTLACIAKTSRADVWSYVGKPPRPVTGMPPAHVGGTLYWMGEQAQDDEEAPSGRAVVALGISARAFHVLPCDPCRHGHHDDDAFLVELNGTLSLVVANAEAEELQIWAMHSPGSWTSAHKVCLQGRPGFSLKTEVVVPVDEVDTDGSRILLNTGRALGYYDARTGALGTIYSLNQMQLPTRSHLAFPMLVEESLADIPDDELTHQDAPPQVSLGGYRSIFHKCERTAGCQRNADVYSTCCRRLVCRECVRRCLAEHPYGIGIPLQASYSDVIAGIRSNGLPMEHPLVPGPDYCYYYSTVDGNVARHVFVSLKDLVRNKQPRHLTECVYRMDGHHVVRDTWACRYIEDDEGS